ncbi:hypothetical protein E2C01_046785 [Portunus trituberculatus]|uniref:Secreted protein n=1 Tax=Portunus trituberculatus TaxID=210409 RepID=A0A5B7G602_PORTR|nr:hypothetical protein [Portunus trituberculatus]
MMPWFTILSSMAFVSCQASGMALGVWLAKGVASGRSPWAVQPWCSVAHRHRGRQDPPLRLETLARVCSPFSICSSASTEAVELQLNDICCAKGQGSPKLPSIIQTLLTSCRHLLAPGKIAFTEAQKVLPGQWQSLQLRCQV